LVERFTPTFIMLAKFKSIGFHEATKIGEK